MKTDKDALAGDWGRANKEPCLGLPGDGDGFGQGRGSSQLHDDNNSRCRCRRRRGVHNDAERAMVGVSLIGVKVSDLGDGDEGH